MNKEAFIVFGNGRYNPGSGNDPKLFLLVMFLTDDLCCYKDDDRPQFLIDWALSDSVNWQGGNIAYLDKFEDQIILEIEYLEGRMLEMHKKNFAELIKKWMEYCKTRPKKITLTREGDKIKMSA